MPSNKLVALWCWYHGAAFRGYQSQPVGPTVQDTLVAALRAAGFDRNPVASGRTDLGVHARMQVLSLRVVEGVEAAQVASRLNAGLPSTVGIALGKEARPKFQAAWLATGKTYRYRLLLGNDERWAGAAWRVDVRPELVHEVLARCVGTHNFWAFHDKSSSERPRTVNAIELSEPTPGLIELEIKGEGFARYMIRFLIGAAVAVARGELSEEPFVRGLEQQVAFDPPKAPAHGLILWEVSYPTAIDPFTEEERRGLVGPRRPPFSF